MSEYTVEMKKINMVFNNGAIVANKDIDLKVKTGEIHAIVGENGAGKSTLMSILFGLYKQTSGEIFINGKLEDIANPIKAKHLGIGMVHQHFKLVDIFPLWQNIALGDEIDTAKMFVNKKEITKKIEGIMAKYNLKVDLNKITSKATVGEQQRAEILKILYRDADILVFDEPTAVLTPIEIDGLLDVMLQLKKDGKTIIFITHKMAEIKKVVNTATVIRRGELVGTYDIKTTTVEKLAEAMVGRKLVEVKNKYKEIKGETVLKVEGVNVAKRHGSTGLSNFDLKIRRGEIVAIAGVEGNGQQEIAQVITGMMHPDSGKVLMHDHDITRKSIAERYKKWKISHIPEDRHKHGLVLDNTVIENMALQDISSSKFSKLGFISFDRLQTYAQDIVSKFDVRGTQSGFAIARQLSGGNQQKAIVGRELSREHDLIVVYQPTRGLDVGSIEFIHNELLKDKENGAAILLISYELSEVMSLADKIVVVNSGKIVGEVLGKDAVREKLGQMMMQTVADGGQK
jgi:ABC-type uncharacterized transport system ATPase subunit